MKALNLIITFLCVQFTLLSQQTLHESIMHDNLQREYILFVPSAYNTNISVPLVFCLHGYGDTAGSIMSYSHFNQIADTANFIVVYPQGTLFQGVTHWNVGGWSTGSTADDVGFIDALIDSVSGLYNVDLSRVYCTGMSNGGFMSYRIACELNSKIAAIASVAGSMIIQTQSACNPVHPTPILEIHGDSDNSIPYNGNSWSKPISDVMLYWANYNNCNTTPTITPVPDINQIDGSTAEYIVYDGGNNGTTAELFKIAGGGHDWPGVWGNMDFSATMEILRFFSKYNINGLVGTADSEELNQYETNVTIYPNPTNSKLIVQGEFYEPKDFAISSIIGENLLSGQINSNTQQIDVSNLRPGLYILEIDNQIFKILKSK